MSVNNLASSKRIAIITARTTPWLGWDLQFEKSLSQQKINELIPLIEKHLNNYLEEKIDVVKNKLVVPFNCRLVASPGNAGAYIFKVTIFKKFIFINIPFNYPQGPVLAINHFHFVKTTGVESQTSSLALKPPAPVN